MENTTASGLLSIMPQTDIHPLLLSPVTSKVMEYLSTRDLVACRLVCQQWNRAACLSLRLQKRKTIKFRMKLENLEQYTTIMAKSPDKPFCFYELEFFDMSNPTVEYFLETCGKTMNSLQLNMCRCTTMKMFEILQKQAPQLKSLSMNMDPIEDVGSILTLSKTFNGKKLSLPHLSELSLIGEHSQNPRLISDLIEAACNLEKIDLRCYDLDCETSPFEIMCFDVITKINDDNNNNNSTQVSSHSSNVGENNNDNDSNNNNNSLISSARYIIEEEERRQQSQTLKKLKKFSMHYRLDNDEQLIRLSRKNLCLTHLNMNVNCTTISPKILFNLLEGLSHTLENLELDFGPGSGSQEKLYKFPLLRKLTRLVLTQFKGSSLSYLLNNNYTLNCLRYLGLINCGPLLASFFDLDQMYSTISTTSQATNTMTNISSTSLSKEISCKLESLVITTIIEDPLVISQISTVFPNLISLDAQLTSSTLRTVFERIPQLEELILSCGDKINDEAITGISDFSLIWLALEDDENMMMDYENNFSNAYRDHEDMTCDEEEQTHKENEESTIYNIHKNKEEDEELEEDEYYGPKKSKRRQYRQFPYIGDLQSLRVLKLYECNSLSDASVIHGISHNKNLTSISLTNSQITDISLRCIADRLTRLRKFETLSPNSIFTHEEKQYLRKKLYMCDFILGYKDLQNIYCPKFKFSSPMEMLLDFFSN